MTSEIPPGVAMETVWLVEATYAPDATETRPAHRPTHLARLATLRDEGVVIEAGGFADMSASVLLIRAADEAAALDLCRQDVYLREGVWVELRARPFGRVVRPSELTPA
jgi:uncharacterized protein YciI